VPEGMLGPGLAPLVDGLRGGLLVLGLQFELDLFVGQPDDLAPPARLGAAPVVPARVADGRVGDHVVPLARAFFRRFIPEPVTFRAAVVILLWVIRKMAFAERLFRLFPRLPL